MNYKILIGFLAITLLLPATFAAMYSNSDVSWKGFVEIFLEKDSFNENEDIKGSVLISNYENSSLIGGRLVLQVVEGEYDYPSQFTKENIIYENSIEDIWLIPIYGKKVDFVIPKINSGNYRIDAYFWVLKSKMVGSNSILYNPISKELKINGEQTKRVVIQRDKTNFEGLIGQEGFPIGPGKEFTGKVFIKNESNLEKKDLVLEISMCDWSVAFCNENTVIKKQIKIGNLASQEEKEIQVKLTAPIIPSAYEINMEINSNGIIESIYKNRAIVTGGTAKLRKIFMTRIENENYGFTATFTGSPDHFTNPDFENFELIFELYNLDKKIEEKKEQITLIKSIELQSSFFKIDSKEFDKACIIIEKDKLIYEKECFSIKLKELKEMNEQVYPKLVNVSWEYDQEKELLEIILKKEVINAKLILLSEDKTIFEEEVFGKIQKYSKTISTPKKTIILIVDDKDALIQQSFTLTLDQKVDLTQNADYNEEENIICSGQICQEGFTCNGPSQITPQGTCCFNECVKTIEYNEEKLIPNILFVSIILFIIAIFIVSSTFKKVKK